MSWRPHHTSRDPIVWLVPLFAPGAVAAVWPAFDRWLEVVTWWLAGLVALCAVGALVWAFWGPRPGERDRWN